MHMKDSPKNRLTVSPIHGFRFAVIMLLVSVLLPTALIAVSIDVSLTAYSHPVYSGTGAHAVCSVFLDLRLPVRSLGIWDGEVGRDSAYLVWYTLPGNPSNGALLKFELNTVGECLPGFDRLV